MNSRPSSFLGRSAADIMLELVKSTTVQRFFRPGNPTPRLLYTLSNLVWVCTYILL